MKKPDLFVSAYRHVQRMESKADSRTGGAPLWHGWALRNAFMAGARWQRRKKAAKGGR
jgi:hypothetical protein